MVPIERGLVAPAAVGCDETARACRVGILRFAARQATSTAIPCATCCLQRSHVISRGRITVARVELTLRATSKRGAIEIVQAQRALLPIKVFHRKSASISSQSVRQIVVAQYLPDAVGDFNCIATTQEESIGTVPQTQAEVGSG